MTVYDLNRDQLIEVKQHMLVERLDERGESPSWGELADADDIISDEEVYEEYGGTYFSPADFSGGEEELFSLDLGDCTGTRVEIAETLHGIANRINDGSFGGISFNTNWGLDQL